MIRTKCFVDSFGDCARSDAMQERKTLLPQRAWANSSACAWA